MAGYSAGSPMGRRHPPVAILSHARRAVLWGARGYAAIARRGRDQPIDFMHRIGYRRTPASWGAIQAALSRLDAAAPEAALPRDGPRRTGPAT